MSRKIVSILTAAVLSAVMAVPAFAAGSPDSANASAIPITVPAETAAAKGYTVTPEELQLTATSVNQAVQLALTAASDPVAGVAEGISNPADISLAKLDILKNVDLQKYIMNNGGIGLIVASKTLTSTDGKGGSRSFSISILGVNPGDKITILYYVPGDPNPHYETATVNKNGKISVKLPATCTYHVVK